jgi:RNA-directed DNA polymerase
MRRVCGRKVTAQYPGRSAALSERTRPTERRSDGVAEVSRGIVVLPTRTKAEHNETERTKVSMSGGDTEKKAYDAGAGRMGVDGIHKDKDTACQGLTATKEIASPGAMMVMEQVVGHENLHKALRRVKSNKGAAGIDGMTVDGLEPHLKEHWKRIRQELLSGEYAPQPVRRVDIPKPGRKGTRMLGIPTVVDRFIQQAVLQVLTPIFDPTFSESSYGFRPGRSQHQAIKTARKYVESGNRWIVDMDLEKFFDRVNHDVLMSRVARRVKDKRILKLIRGFLSAGIMFAGVVQVQEEGTPQGGPLSPLLSNILLDDLDKELEKRGHAFCRFADDCNVYVKSKVAGERVMESVTRFLARRLRLMVNHAKSAVARPWKRKFLGYSMTMHYKPKLKVSPESVKRLKGDLREIFRRGRGRKLTSVITEITGKIAGWANYYKLSQVKNIFEELDQWIRRKLRCILWRQWKKPKTRAKKMIQLGLKKERGWQSAMNGRGPWWNAGASHMNACVPAKMLHAQGLVSLLYMHQRFVRSM